MKVAISRNVIIFLTKEEIIKCQLYWRTKSTPVRLNLFLNSVKIVWWGNIIPLTFLRPTLMYPTKVATKIHCNIEWYLMGNSKCINSKNMTIEFFLNTKKSSFLFCINSLSNEPKMQVKERRSANLLSFLLGDGKQMNQILFYDMLKIVNLFFQEFT